MKRFISGFILGAMIFATIGAVAVTYVATPASFKVLVNGEDFVSDPPAMVINDRTYLPLRAMGDALGVPVEWNAEKQQAEVGVTSASATYSRTNPAPMNTAQTYTKENEWFEEDNYTVTIKVLETVRGDAAYKTLNMGGLTYPEANDGYEYMNVKIAFSVVETKGDYSVEASQGYFKTFTSSNEECPYNYYVSKEPYLTGSLYAGGKTEGWITVMVKKDDANPKLAYGLDYNGAGGIWFALN